MCIWSTASLNPANLSPVQSFAPAVTYKGRWLQYQLNSKYWSLKYKLQYYHFEIAWQQFLQIFKPCCLPGQRAGSRSWIKCWTHLWNSCFRTELMLLDWSHVLWTEVEIVYMTDWLTGPSCRDARAKFRGKLLELISFDTDYWYSLSKTFESLQRFSGRPPFKAVTAQQ